MRAVLDHSTFVTDPMDNQQNSPNQSAGGEDRPSRFSPAPGGDRLGGGTGLGDRPGGQGGPGGPGGDRPGGERFGGERPGGERGPRRYGSGGRGGGGRGGGGGRRKQPIFADNEVVDYKDIQRLRQCIDERGKLLPRRKTYCSAGKQRELTVAVKRARHLALLMFVPADRRR